ALVRRLVEMHGGSVSATSGGSGAGSEFVVRLPTLAARPAAVRAPDAAASAGDPTERRIRVVDDNRDSARSMALLLRTSGKTVQIASDGLEAVEAAERFRPHIVLLDIGMPKLDGYAAARWIRAKTWGKSIKLVAVSGW